MNECPSLLIEFDPLTWEMKAIYFKAATDVEKNKLTEILVQGVQCKMREDGSHDA